MNTANFQGKGGLGLSWKVERTVWRAVVKFLRKVIIAHSYTGTSVRKGSNKEAVSTFTVAIDKSCENVKNGVESTISKHYLLLDQYLNQNGLMDGTVTPRQEFNRCQRFPKGFASISDSEESARVSWSKLTVNVDESKEYGHRTIVAANSKSISNKVIQRNSSSGYGRRVVNRAAEKSLDESDLWNVSSESDDSGEDS